MWSELAEEKFVHVVICSHDSALIQPWPAYLLLHIKMQGESTFDSAPPGEFVLVVSILHCSTFSMLPNVFSSCHDLIVYEATLLAVPQFASRNSLYHEATLDLYYLLLERP